MTVQRSKRALICGVSGQDGAYLARLLLEKGYRAVGTSRDAQTANFDNLRHLGIAEQVETHSMVLTDFRSVIQTLMRAEADEIYNLSGQSSVGLSFQQPVETFESITLGVTNLLEAIRFLGSKARIYNACSSECFGDTEGKPATEETPFRPSSPYATAKAAAFWATANYREAYGIHACSGILFNHELPLRPRRFVTRKIISAACAIAKSGEGVLQLGNLNVYRDWGWAPEYVDAMWRMLQLDEPCDLVIATGESHSIEEFYKTTFEELNLDYSRHVVSSGALFRPSDIQFGRGDASLAERKLGWKAQYRMRDVIREMIKAEVSGEG